MGGNTIEADLVLAHAEATCSSGGASASGGSEVVRLVLNGQAIPVGTEPNLTFNLPNGRVVLNEQTESAGGNSAWITVIALRVVVDGIAEVAISSAHVDVVCGGQPQCVSDRDFVTGGGFITGSPSGARANLGVAGGIKQGRLWGHLTYIDHGSRIKVKGTGVTGYTILDAATRRIEGTAEINGWDGFTYKVTVADNGEPGSDDTFDISLSNGYAAGGFLEGGNIQLHEPCK